MMPTATQRLIINLSTFTDRFLPDKPVGIAYLNPRRRLLLRAAEKGLSPHTLAETTDWKTRTCPLVKQSTSSHS
nr:hypothetical protein RKHAN_02504 [Rhizobium sp. Khangiran2]